MIWKRRAREDQCQERLFWKSVQVTGEEKFIKTGEHKKRCFAREATTVPSNKQGI